MNDTQSDERRRAEAERTPAAVLGPAYAASGKKAILSTVIFMSSPSIIAGETSGCARDWTSRPAAC